MFFLPPRAKTKETPAHIAHIGKAPPKFEIFADRLEITSSGSLPEGLSEKEFFEGYTIPRNKELMRVYKDLELVEQLGTGVPRIIEHYGKEYFHFSENFIRMVFSATDKVTTQVTTQAEQLLGIFTGEYDRKELQDKLGLANREHFRKTYLQPALNEKLIELTIPNKPNSSKQKYRLTEKGKQIKKK